MPRIARIVIPDHPHHITQRGNRRQTVFFSNEDYAAYLDYLTAALKKSQLQVWAYCLMPNHVHLVIVPETGESLRFFLVKRGIRSNRDFYN
ncbi:MAG: transposase [Gammaproteobacteria bacterium]